MHGHSCGHGQHQLGLCIEQFNSCTRMSSRTPSSLLATATLGNALPQRAELISAKETCVLSAILSRGISLGPARKLSMFFTQVADQRPCLLALWVRSGWTCIEKWMSNVKLFSKQRVVKSLRFQRLALYRSSMPAKCTPSREGRRGRLNVKRPHPGVDFSQYVTGLNR